MRLFKITKEGNIWGYNERTEDMGKENAKKLFDGQLHFYKKDTEIKETMLKLAPTEMDDYNEESRIEYTDKLNKFLKETEDEIIIIAEKSNFDTKVMEAIKKYFTKAKETLLIGSYQKYVGQEMYRKTISSMSKKLMDEVERKIHRLYIRKFR